MKKIVTLLITGISLLMSCSKSSDDDGTGPVINPPGGTPVVRYKNFNVQGRSLKDSSGNSFVIRGNNFPVFWFPAQYKTSLGAAAALGCNAARIVWQVEQQPWTPALAVLDEALAECAAKKLVPVVELHDFTGGTSASDITTAAAWFTSTGVKTILDKYSHILIINIANEWGSGTVSELYWKNAYLPAITTIRNAGYKVPILIDAPGYGQNENAIVLYGKELLQSDPLKNVLFAVHAYSGWNNPGTYAGRINAMLDKDLCIVFGEFGWNVPDNQQPADFVCKVDAPLLMKLCQQYAVGYMGWSWMGNNAANACFDMSTSWSDTSHLTAWGRQWAYDANGVKNTGIKASIFQ